MNINNTTDKMKKLLFIAAAVAAMAACTKSEVVYDDTDVAIDLAPVNYKATKSVTGPYTGNEYSDAEQFRVWAAYTSLDAGTEFRMNTELSVYLDNVVFGKKENSGVWGGTPVSYYWPKSGSLYFAGYSPADATVENAEYEFNTGSSKMTLTGFTQGAYSYVNSLDAIAQNTNYKMIDLLYFDVASDTKSVNSGTHPVLFKHALSWLTFRFRSAAGMDNLFKVNKITLNNVSTKETFTSGAGTNNWPAPVWTANNSAPESFVIYDANFNQTTAGDNVLVNGGFIPVEGILVIPQTAKSLTIEYEQKAAVDQPFVKQNPLTIELSDVTDNSANKISSWEINKHYLYTITMSADEILIDPSIDLWENVDASDYEVK